MRTLPIQTPVVTPPRIGVRVGVELAAGLFDAAPGVRRSYWDDPIERLYGRGPAIADPFLDCRPRTSGEASAARRRAAVQHFVSVSPGVVALRAGKPAGWEPDTDDAESRDEVWQQRQGVLRGLSQHDEPASLVRPGRAAISAWSPKSRRSMLRSLASYDWSPVFEHRHPRALITLTYGSDWVSVAPDAPTSKKHLEAFRSAYTRDVGIPWGSWKLEFQMRGAPHYHLMMVAPKAITLRGVLVPFDEWVATTWARIVGHDDKAVGEDGRTEYERHLAVQRGPKVVDWEFGRRCDGPTSLAAYMMKHNAPGGFSKEYQHDVPAEWSGDREPHAGYRLDHEAGVQGPTLPAAEGPTLFGAGPGRFWGVWKLERCEVEVEVRADDAVELARMLRKVVAARGGRARQVRRRRVNRKTGVIGYRTVSVPWKTTAHRRRWVLFDSGPAAAAAFARALLDPVEWQRGERRPLP